MKKISILSLVNLAMFLALPVFAFAQSGDFCYTFGRNLKEGDRGPDVSRLHQALQKEGFDLSSSDDWAQRVFGDRTADMVTGFQQKYQTEILLPAGLKYGTGFAGPATRRKLNRLFSCETNPKQPSPIIQEPINSTYIQNPGLEFIGWAREGFAWTRESYFTDGRCTFDLAENVAHSGKRSARIACPKEDDAR